MNLDTLKTILLGPSLTLKDYLERHRTYGLSVERIEDGFLAERLTIGKGIYPTTLFQAASMSKSIFAATLMKLQEQRRLDLHKNLAVDIEAMLGIALPQGCVLTYMDLLSHTGGFNVHGFCGYLPSQAIPTGKDILFGKRPANNPPLENIHLPQTKFSYSGGGYQLAQALLEETTQKAFPDWAQELVFDPLGMTKSTYDLPKRNSRAVGWSCHDSELTLGYVRYPEAAAAGLWTTPMELGMFGIELMKALRGESAWLRKESAEALLKKPEGIQTDYAHGFKIETFGDALWFGHGGDNIGFHARMLFCPSKGCGIVIMVSSDIGDFIPNAWAETYANALGKKTP